MKRKVMIISAVHRWDDTRIFHREAKSLARNFYVELHAPADFETKDIDGVRVVGLPKWEKKRDRIYLWWILLKRTLKSDADIIHFHDPELIPLAYVIKLLLRKKIIYDVHEHIIFDIESKTWIPQYLKSFIICVFKSVEKICVPTFDVVIYTTPEVGERYQKHSKRAISIENYSKLSTFRQGQRDISCTDPAVIYLGRVLSVRGVEQVIRAFKAVVRRIPDAKFLIVGDIVPSSYEEYLKALTRQLSLEANVKFLGFIPHLESLRYLDMASCGVVTFLPTRVNQACLPNKLFEYMASGLPVIASDFYKRIVDDCKCGVTVDPENVEMISHSIVDMLENSTLTVQMGTNGRRAFEAKYNWEKEEVKLLQLYNDLVTS